MTETAGSTSMFAPGFVAPRTPDYRKTPRFDDTMRDAYKQYEALKMAREYERILNKPAEERTFAEKMFVAQMRFEKVLDKINLKCEPKYMYTA